MDGFRRWLAILVVAAPLMMSDLCCGRPLADYMRFVYKICNGNLDPDQVEFKSCLENIFNFLPNDTVRYGFDFYENSSHGNMPCYTHGVCNMTLSKSDCVRCLETAIKSARGQCGWSIGVQFQLKGCRVRFEKYGFTED
ncbi:hypothetical protein MLD38_037939 [Melastoma candidum]|uniref:Uncharacterized protein n=1 Tax=Melastoma candidum TaxID=119954 RepID=A0ACB9KXM9_9MYRT|nr:hypothetical protein MLD38_037939 [Melastoma candidum]